MTAICCKCRQPLMDEQWWYGLHEKCFEKWFNLTKVSLFLDLVARSQSPGPEEHLSGGISFFNGAYRKYSARLEGVSFILKVKQSEYPELPSTEYLCNQIYDSLSLIIPDYYLVRFPEDCFCFVTKNFMSPLERSDLVHIYHFVKDGKSHTCESLVSIIGEQTGRKSDQERFVCMTLADSLIGNNDRHGRNLGFIRSPKGMQLAPFYDNPSALALEDHTLLGADLQPRGSIFTSETDKPTMKDYVREWKRLGYGYVVERFQRDVSLEKICFLVENSHVSEKRQKALLKLIFKRNEELCGN